MTIPFDAVIFDMDGLLVDSEPVWMTCEQGMLAQRGKSWSLDIQKKLIGMRMKDFLEGMIREYELTDSIDDMTSEIVGLMCQRIPVDVQVRPGAPELLVYLQQVDIPCAIASSSPMVIIDTVVESQGWQRYFPLRVSGDEVVNGKPNADIYLETARRMGVEASRCLALEDSVNGARASVAAGMTTYAVPDPSHAHADHFEDITPHVFESLHDVLASLKRAAVAPRE